jgi:tryptophan synthase alpha chain
MVSSSSTTGAGKKVEDFQQSYFERIQNMKLKNPCLIGFGISDRPTFKNACKYANGAIVGSAFIQAVQSGIEIDKTIPAFVRIFL